MSVLYGVFSGMLALTGLLCVQMVLLAKKIEKFGGKISRVEFALFGKDPDPDPEDGIYPIVGTLMDIQNTLVSVKGALEEMKEEVNKYASN